MSENAGATTSCIRCDTAIEECACCDEPDCSVPICHHCLSVAVGQEMRHPHAHGG